MDCGAVKSACWGYDRQPFPVLLGKKTAIIQLLLWLIGPTLRPIVLVARATYRTEDSFVLLGKDFSCIVAVYLRNMGKFSLT